MPAEVAQELDYQPRCIQKQITEHVEGQYDGKLLCPVVSVQTLGPTLDRPECLYVGMSEACMRQRLLQHLPNETNPELLRQLRMFRDIVMFSAAFTEGRQETLALETAVIQAWQPLKNRTKLG